MAKRTRILMLITRAELGGGQTHVADLLRGLRAEFDVHLGTSETGYLTEAAAEIGVPCHIIPEMVQPIQPWNDLLALRALVHLVRKLRPDLVHAHTSKAGILGRMAARITGVPSVFTAHTWCFAEGTSWKWQLIGTPAERMAGKWSGRIINVSDANRELALSKGIAGAGKHVTIHNGIADCRWRANPGEAETPKIVMIARFVAQKAQSLLIEAVRGIECPFELLFIGDGPSRAGVERQVVEAGLAGRVKFLGARMDVPQLLSSSHIFALFTHWEGFPISILEAMRAGLPIVASDVGGIREAFQTSCGLLVPAGDVQSFRNALERLLKNPQLRADLGRAARSQYEREFTVEVMLKRTTAVYRSVTEGRLGEELPGYAVRTGGSPSYQRVPD